MNALVNFDKPLVAAVHGAAIGGGTTMLTHCDFIYAGESTKFQMPFINLAVVPEFGSSCSVPARIGHLRAAELILLGAPFDARRAAELGLVTQVISDKDVLARATETAGKLAAKPAAALQASKRLMKQPFREQIRAAMKAENEEFSAQVRSEDAKEAFTAFLEQRKPDLIRSGPAVLTDALGVGRRPYGGGVWGRLPGAVVSGSRSGIGAFGAYRRRWQLLVFLHVPTVQQPGG